MAIVLSGMVIKVKTEQPAKKGKKKKVKEEYDLFIFKPKNLNKK
jgi:hypothetical protein